MIPDKYENVLHEINVEIEKFNLFLVEEFRIAPLNGSNIKSGAVFEKGVPWKDQECLPDRLHPGVYILCAYRQSDPSKLGAYIGKSSVNRDISSRLSAHLKRHSADGVYQDKDKLGELYIYEAVVVIGFHNHEMRALAPALEEFIIAGVRERIHLLNSIGN